VLSNSIVRAFRHVQVNTEGQIPAQTITPLPKTNLVSKAQEAFKQKQRDKMRNMAKEIIAVMAPLIEQGKVRVLETSRGVSVEINDSVLFPPGQAVLQAPLAKAMKSIADVLVTAEFPVTIEGHTDNVPISNAQFPSNWELSAVRATTVLRLFADAGVAPERLTAIGYADTRPVEANTLVEGRARNRRVTILIEANLPDKRTELDLNSPADARSAAASGQATPPR
jgi:chemotaxis protein MotB